MSNGSYVFAGKVLKDSREELSHNFEGRRPGDSIMHTCTCQHVAKFMIESDSGSFDMRAP